MAETQPRQLNPYSAFTGPLADEGKDVLFDIDWQGAKQIAEAAPTIDGVSIEFGGQVFAEFESPSSEILGLAFAIVILILAFGSVLAMGLPIGVALFGIGIGSVSVALLSNVFTIPDFATVLGVMIGLGVGIGLFEIEDQRHQRFGDEASAENAEMPRCIGAAAE